MAKRWAFLLLLLATNAIVLNVAAAGSPAIFILGDSTADVGTNSFLPRSVSRADFPFNGIDFHDSTPSGRFSNGFNSADFLAKLLGYDKSPPPFLSLKKSSSLMKQSLTGINFASGGSGLFRFTGQSMTPVSNSSTNGKNCISLREQIQQFAEVRSTLVTMMGPLATEKFLSKSLFFISTGSNDIFRHFQLNSSSSKQDLMTSLGIVYEVHLKALLKLGARKFGIISVAPIGCCPSQRIQNSTGGCLEELNNYARAFHAMVESLLYKLSSEFEGMKYSLGNAYEMTINVLDNPLAFNFTEVEAACCGAGRSNAESICDGKANLCLNRDQHLFWDLFHPTEAADKLAALTLFSGPTRFVAPINFSQLALA